MDIRPGIYQLCWKKEEVNALEMLVDASSAGNIKPIQVIEALLRGFGENLRENALLIIREETYANIGTDKREFVPLGAINL